MEHELADARHLEFDSEFDAAYAMCQGAFGLQGGPAAGHDLGNLDGDRSVLRRMRRAVKADGVVGVAAFSAYFQVRNLEGGTDEPPTPNCGPPFYAARARVIGTIGRPEPNKGVVAAA